MQLREISRQREAHRGQHLPVEVIKKGNRKEQGDDKPCAGYWFL